MDTIDAGRKHDVDRDELPTSARSCFLSSAWLCRIISLFYAHLLGYISFTPLGQGLHSFTSLNLTFASEESSDAEFPSRRSFANFKLCTESTIDDDLTPSVIFFECGRHPQQR